MMCCLYIMEEDIIHYTDGRVSCGEGKEFVFP